MMETTNEQVIEIIDNSKNVNFTYEKPVYNSITLGGTLTAKAENTYRRKVQSLQKLAQSSRDILLDKDQTEVDIYILGKIDYAKIPCLDSSTKDMFYLEDDKITFSTTINPNTKEGLSELINMIESTPIRSVVLIIPKNASVTSSIEQPQNTVRFMIGLKSGNKISYI